jgi:hypothetical protein
MDPPLLAMAKITNSVGQGTFYDVPTLVTQFGNGDILHAGCDGKFTMIQVVCYEASYFLF